MDRKNTPNGSSGPCAAPSLDSDVAGTVTALDTYCSYAYGYKLVESYARVADPVARELRMAAAWQDLCHPTADASTRRVG